MLAAVTLASGMALPARAQEPWTTRLITELSQIDGQNQAKIGVYVRDIDTGVSASYKAEQRWYLASLVKVPVAIAVLRGIERGQFSLDTTLTLRAGDYVDGAGLTNSHPVGTLLPIRYLLAQMLIYSDNTASDMLIGLVGIAEVNLLAEAIAPDGFRRITPLGDIRRLIYGALVPRADKLTGQDLMALQRLRADADRLQMLSNLAETPVARFRMTSLDAAYNAYYATGLNSGRLDAYGELLAQLADGRLLGAAHTQYLLKLMTRTATGTQRIKAGLPDEVSFAHKTGTQRRRTCDAGIVRMADGTGERRLAVVACTRDEASTTRSDQALMQVGIAICRSGLLTKGKTDAPYASTDASNARPCRALPDAGRLPAEPDLAER